MNPAKEVMEGVDYLSDEYICTFKPFGEFTCKSCETTFPKSDGTHGSSGYCCQCEIGLGLIEIHNSPEANKMERQRTMMMIGVYKRAMANMKIEG